MRTGARNAAALQLQIDNAFANCVGDEAGRVMNVRLLHDVVAMSIDRANADVKRLCDLQVRFPLGNIAQNLAFSARQRAGGDAGTGRGSRGRRGTAAEVSFENHF